MSSTRAAIGAFLVLSSLLALPRALAFSTEPVADEEMCDFLVPFFQETCPEPDGWIYPVVVHNSVCLEAVGVFGGFILKKNAWPPGVFGGFILKKNVWPLIPQGSIIPVVMLSDVVKLLKDSDGALYASTNAALQGWFFQNPSFFVILKTWFGGLAAGLAPPAAAGTFLEEHQSTCLVRDLQEWLKDKKVAARLLDISAKHGLTGLFWYATEGDVFLLLIIILAATVLSN